MSFDPNVPRGNQGKMVYAIKTRNTRKLEKLLKKHGVLGFKLLLETAIAAKDPNAVKLLLAAAEKGGNVMVFPESLLFSENVVFGRVKWCRHDKRRRGCGRKCTKDHLNCDCKWRVRAGGSVIGPYRNGKLNGGENIAGMCTFTHQGEHFEYEFAQWGDWEAEVVNMLLECKTRPTTELVCCAWRNQDLCILEKALALGYKPDRKLCSYILKSVVGRKYNRKLLMRLAEDVEVLKWFFSQAPTLRYGDGVDLVDLLIPESKELGGDEKMADLLHDIKEDPEFRSKLLTRFWDSDQHNKFQTLFGCGILPNRRFCERMYLSMGAIRLGAGLNGGGIIRDIVVSLSRHFFKVSIKNGDPALATLLFQSELVCGYDRRRLLVDAEMSRSGYSVVPLLRGQLQHQLAFFESVLVALGLPRVLVELMSSYL